MDSNPASIPTSTGSLEMFLEEQKRLVCSQSSSTSTSVAPSRNEAKSNAASGLAVVALSNPDNSLVVSFDDEVSDDETTTRNVFVSSTSQHRTPSVNAHNKPYTPNALRTTAQPGGLHVLRRGIAKPPGIRGRGRGVTTLVRGRGRGAPVATSTFASNSNSNNQVDELNQQIIQLRKKIEEKKNERAQANNFPAPSSQPSGAAINSKNNKSQSPSAAATSDPPPQHLDLTKINPSVMMSLSEMSVNKLESSKKKVKDKLDKVTPADSSISSSSLMLPPFL